MSENVYMIDTIEYGRAVKRLHVSRFAADLCAALGGEMDPQADDGRVFMVGELSVWVNGANTGGVDKVSVSCSASRKVRQHLAGGSRTVYPCIGISTSKPMARIAAEVQKRLIDPASEPLAKDLGDYNRDKAQRAATEAHAADLRQAFPWIAIQFRDDRATSAEVHCFDPYLIGRLACDGGLYVERMETLKGANVAALLTMLQGLRK